MSTKKTNKTVTKAAQDAQEIEALRLENEFLKSDFEFAKGIHAADLQDYAQLKAENAELRERITDMGASITNIIFSLDRKVKTTQDWLEYIGLLADGLREIA